MAQAQFLLGPGGKLILANGRAIGGIPGAAVETPSGTLSIKPVDWYMSLSSGYTTRFNIQTTAASGDTTADVPVVFTYTGTAPTAVQARVISGTGAEVVPWTDITSSVSVDATNLTGLGYLRNVPDGIDYRREVRVGTSSTITGTDTVRFNVGTNVLPWGQSNGRGTLDGGKTRDDAIPGTVYTELTYYNANGTGAYFGPYGFVAGGTNSISIGSYNVVMGGGLALLRLLGTTLQNKRGHKIGVALNPWVQNATALGGFINTTTGVAPMLANAGTVGPNIGFSSPAQIITGDYRIVAWHQGESESGSLTRAQRLDDLKKFCLAHIAQVAKFGRPANKLTFLFAIMGVANPPQMEVLRGAVLDLVAYGATQGWDVRIGWNCIDLDPGNATPPDTLHFGAADQIRSIRRLAQACMHVLDSVAVPYGARGPMLTGAATRAGDDITLTVAHEGGTALAAKTPGAPLTGWYANTAADFSGTDVPLTNVTILSATQIRVTATGAPATFYIKYDGHKLYTALSYHPDVSNPVYDNFAYPTGANAGEQSIGLPLLPTPDAIKVGP